MKTRISTLSAALIGAIALPALATSGYSPADSELGYTTHPAAPSTTTRTQVMRELAAWNSNPLANGWREVGGDIGWLYVGPTASAISRTKVQRDLADWTRRPVTADGWKDIGGEVGFVYVGRATDTGTRSVAGAK